MNTLLIIILSVIATSSTARAKYTHAQALAIIQNAGIGIYSSKGCSTRDKGCTSLDQIRENTISQIVAFKSATPGCPITITGGTEPGHSISGTFTHSNGYKVDIRLNSCVDNYITTRFTSIGKRRDGAAQYRAPGNNIYAKEGDHWDILYP